MNEIMPPFSYNSAYEDYRAGAFKDVSLPGALIPPLGLYQLFSNSPDAPSSFSSSIAPSGRRSDSSSMIAKIALVAGGALAIYLIYRVSTAFEKASSPIHEKAGALGAKLAGARYGGGKSGARLAGKSSSLKVLASQPSLRALPSFTSSKDEVEDAEILSATDAYR